MIPTAGATARLLAASLSGGSRRATSATAAADEPADSRPRHLAVQRNVSVRAAPVTTPARRFSTRPARFTRRPPIRHGLGTAEVYGFPLRSDRFNQQRRAALDAVAVQGLDAATTLGCRTVFDGEVETDSSAVFAPALEPLATVAFANSATPALRGYRVGRAGTSRG